MTAQKTEDQYKGQVPYVSKKCLGTGKQGKPPLLSEENVANFRLQLYQIGRLLALRCCAGEHFCDLQLARLVKVGRVNYD
jgi:hypothetical protein